MPPITLWFFQSSRSIRIAWLLEELGLNYDIRFANRMSNMKAPQDFKASSGNPLGKFPSLKDGDTTLYESGAITEYLCETYDTHHKFLPSDLPQRIKVLQWLHASEATFMLHALAITYARVSIPSTAPSSILLSMEERLAVNVQNDLDWLEAELSSPQSKFLCGDYVTVADTMMQFSVELIFVTKLGTRKREWPNVRRWLRACKETDMFGRAVEKSGYKITKEWPETE